MRGHGDCQAYAAQVVHELSLLAAVDEVEVSGQVVVLQIDILLFVCVGVIFGIVQELFGE